MKPVINIIFIFSLFIFSCNNNDKIKTKDSSLHINKAEIFELTDISTSINFTTLLAQNWENKDDVDDRKVTNDSYTLDMPYRGFSLFSDNTLTKNPKDDIKFGKWAFDEKNKTLNFSYDDGSYQKYKIAALGCKEMILLNLSDKIKTTYVADAKVEKILSNNPFYASNNRWRIKPNNAENDSALKQRVLAAVLFYQKYLSDNIATGTNVISFVGLPAFFKWYSGGIGTIAKENLGTKMINCFYNKTQAQTAEEILQNIITKKFVWDNDEKNWVKQDIGVLSQIYDSLKIAK